MKLLGFGGFFTFFLMTFVARAEISPTEVPLVDNPATVDRAASEEVITHDTRAPVENRSAEQVKAQVNAQFKSKVAAKAPIANKKKEKKKASPVAPSTTEN